eukprot:Seg4826.2 transcript_id=Seg4826.2/GoldUCD/mRNA.D3Y31 product="General transcription factor IIH subunit 4" protein_id=Seg4826.2/GoldUCD/D3Y31
MDNSSSSKRLQCKNLYEYLNTLSAAVLDGLYGHPATCMAVFRGLPEMAKQYVMRTLFTEQPIPEPFVATWVQKDSNQRHLGALMKLKGLQIWKEMPKGSSASRYEMNANFKKNLKIVLCGGGETQPDTSKYGEDKHGRDIPFLENYAKERWESVLYYMTGSTSEGGGISEEVINILIKAGLLRLQPEDRTTSITSAGFQFLLMDTVSQVWYFMLQYLEATDQHKADIVEYLSFLFQISFSTYGKDYSVEGLSQKQFNFLQHLREIGLVFQRKRKSRRYYPTKLAINLGSAVTGETSLEVSQHRFVVVETNYRVYAYTDSALQLALISLFCDILCRFPRFSVATLSRESVQQALASGITAEQIIHFLRSRAHPVMLKRTPIIPPTITDQVKLWEMERERLQFTEGVLYNEFLSQSDFETLRKYADDCGVLLWANMNKRLMVVSNAGHSDVKRFWKRYKNK